MKKRILAGLLAFSLMMSLPAAAMAESILPTGGLPPAVELSVEEPGQDPAAEPEQTEQPANTEQSADTEPADAAQPAPAEGEGVPAAEPAAPEAPQADEAEAEEPAATPAVELTGTVGDITVTARAEAGVLPEGVTMQVTALEQEDELDAVAGALDDSPVEYDGFIALDVSFFDGETEIEPQEGAVQVSFELAAALLPEDADPATLAVQHLVEDEAGAVAEVVTVADTDTTSEVAGTVELVETEENAAVVTADFDVESFSTFTITWKNGNTSLAGTRRISFTFIDTDGNVLDLGKDYSFEIGTDSNVKEFSSIIRDLGINKITVDGVEYTYQNTSILVGNGARVPVGSVKRVGSSGDYSLRFFSQVIGESAYYTRSSLGDNEKLYLVYSKYGSNQTVYEVDELKRTKTATSNNDGTYNLELTVAGEAGSTTEKVKMDVLFITDCSNSMTTGKIGTQSYAQVVKETAGELASSLANNSDLDVRFSVVTFGSEMVNQVHYRDAILNLYWTSDATKVSDYTWKDNLGGNNAGGTNYQAGLISGLDALVEARPDALKYVIFISDGAPTFYYDTSGDRQGTGQDGSTNVANSFSAANTFAGQRYTSVNGFYTIRVGNGSNADSYLQDLCNTVKSATNSSDESKFKNYQAANKQALQNAFSEIKATVTKLSCTNVSVTDTLSNYVEAASNAQPAVTVVNANGEVVATPAGITAELTTGGVLKLNFPENYALESGYIYKVSLKIQPTTAAYEYYATNGQYPDKADSNTGTHSGGDGFFSNDSAELKFTFNGTEHTNTYPMPVVQVKLAELQIVKEIEGLSDSEVASVVNALKFTVKQGDTTIKENISLATTANANGEYIATVSNLIPGRTYTVEETANGVAALNNKYTVTTTYDPNNATYTAVAGQTGTVKVKNVYTRIVHDLTITKAANGIDDADQGLLNSAEFVFEISAAEGTDVLVDGTSYQVVGAKTNPITVSDNKLTVTKTGTGDFTIKDLPEGTYTVKEISASDIADYNWTTTDEAKTATGNLSSGNGTATITNTYAHKPKTLTISKAVTGNMGDTNKPFTFTLTVPAGTEIPANSDLTKSEDEGENDKYTFTLSNGDKINITLPYNTAYTVTEDSEEYSASYQVNGGQSVSHTSWSGNLTANTTIAYTNTKNVVPPTGVSSDAAPYLIMVGLALALGGWMLVRRRRELE